MASAQHTVEPDWTNPPTSPELAFKRRYMVAAVVFIAVFGLISIGALLVQVRALIDSGGGRIELIAGPLMYAGAAVGLGAGLIGRVRLAAVLGCFTAGTLAILALTVVGVIQNDFSGGFVGAVAVFVGAAVVTSPVAAASILCARAAIIRNPEGRPSAPEFASGTERPVGDNALQPYGVSGKPATASRATRAFVVTGGLLFLAGLALSCLGLLCKTG